jgi:6-phosphogluconolactonase
MNRPLDSLPVLLLLAFGANAGAAQQPAAAVTGTPATDPYFVYVGTSTGDPANGIHVLRFDPADGSLSRAPVPVARVINPSFLALAPDGRTLYAVSEVENGEVVAFRRDGATGALAELGRRWSGGAGPAYVAVDGPGRWLTVANYGGGSVALLPIVDGALGDPVDVVQHEGSGPDPDRQTAPHAHFAKPSPDGRWVFVADLGIDQVIAYPLVGGTDGLAEARAAITPTAPGAGPRHLAFHPHEPFVFLMNELAGTVTAYRYDEDRGRLTEIQTLSAVPEDFDGENKSADIHVHPTGRWLYASNRGDFDSIAIFAIDAGTGRLTAVGHQREGIVWPRNFVIDPTGRWLLVGNQTANEVRVYAIDPATGRLRPTPHRVDVPGPTNVLPAPGG